jgi:hypothetical protein
MVHLKNDLYGLAGSYAEIWYLRNIGLVALNYSVSIGTNTTDWKFKRELVRFNTEPIKLPFTIFP